MEVSPPTRGRGLKQDAWLNKSKPMKSPPTRGRGLKLEYTLTPYERALVAPHAGAWIETTPSAPHP